MVKSVTALCLALVLTFATRGDAHPLHSSFTEITRDRAGYVSISIRLFSDDYGATLDSLRKESGSSSLESVARQYFARAVTLMSADGKALPVVWCGMRSESGLTWLCARSTQPVPTGIIRVRNALMFDRFRDQISIIRWTGKTESRTIILSARIPEARLN